MAHGDGRGDRGGDHRAPRSRPLPHQAAPRIGSRISSRPGPRGSPTSRARRTSPTATPARWASFDRRADDLDASASRQHTDRDAERLVKEAQAFAKDDPFTWDVLMIVDKHVKGVPSAKRSASPAARSRARLALRLQARRGHLRRARPRRELGRGPLPVHAAARRHLAQRGRGGARARARERSPGRELPGRSAVDALPRRPAAARGAARGALIRGVASSPAPLHAPPWRGSIARGA